MKELIEARIACELSQTTLFLLKRVLDSQSLSVGAEDFVQVAQDVIRARQELDECLNPSP